MMAMYGVRGAGLTLRQAQGQAQTQMQQVRHRKPRWLPIAPSKLFRIPPRAAAPPEDKAELFRLHSQYKTQMKAIRKLFVADYQEEALSITNLKSENAKREEEILFQKAVLENDQWNSRVAEDREIRLKREHEERILKVFTLKEEKQLQREMDLKKAAEELHRLREDAKNFIPREKLDEVIERALNFKTEYNYAVTMKGDIISSAPQDSIKSDPR